MHGGALLGVAYKTSRRVHPVSTTAISAIQSMPLSGFGSSAGPSSFSSFEEMKISAESPPQNFQLYRLKHISKSFFFFFF